MKIYIKRAEMPNSHNQEYDKNVINDQSPLDVMVKKLLLKETIGNYVTYSFVTNERKEVYGMWKKEKFAVDLLCSVNTKVNL
jgi:hypothetical protein